MNSWKSSAETWKRMPITSSALFLAGVFCLFATISLVGSMMSLQSQSRLATIAIAAAGGAFAAVWGFAGTRRIIWLFFVVGALQFLAMQFLGRQAAPHPALSLQELDGQLHLQGYTGIALIVAGYILFLFFVQREGKRFFRTQMEVRLAGEIHSSLVPPRHDTIGTTEFFGISIPSSEVGGDLFDIIESEGSWHAYVADISGHGVAAGILMSMIKSAVSMQLTKLKKPADLLTDLNDVIQPFTAPANYLTFAYVSGEGGEILHFALAGHLPILHYRAQTKTIIEHSDTNVPIGLFKNQTFTVSQLSLPPGDLLAVITDGYTEVFDSEEKEIGLEEFKSMLLACADKPLPEIYRDLRSKTKKFGEQMDDQTILLIRRLA